MLMSSFLLMNSHMFQAANEHKGKEVKSAPGDAVANQHQGIVSIPYLGNQSHNNMEKKQGRICFLFPFILQVELWHRKG